MKLASLKDGSRDGRLIVVSRDLSCYRPAGPLAKTLQQALDSWDEVAPGLQEIYQQLNDNPALADAFSPFKCMAPLPRAYQWADGSAYVNHVKLVRQARGAEMPDSFWTDPLMYQGGSDDFQGPCDPVVATDEAQGIDLEAEVAVITGDVPMGCPADVAGAHIRLLMLVNDVSLRNLIPGELAKGFGFFQSKPATACSPVAVTPDELGKAWRDGRVHADMLSWINDQPLGKVDAGQDMIFNFPQLIAHAAQTRRLSAGSVIGSGTISNQGEDGGPGLTIAEGGRGYSCLAELRMVEKIRTGEISTDFLKFGDHLKIDMLDAADQSIFGAIEQAVTRLQHG